MVAALKASCSARYSDQADKPSSEELALRGLQGLALPLFSQAGSWEDRSCFISWWGGIKDGWLEAVSLFHFVFFKRKKLGKPTIVSEKTKTYNE